MKQNINLNHNIRRKKQHIWKSVKYVIFMLFFCVFSLFARASYSQQFLPPLNFKNVSLNSVFESIEKESNYIFLFADNTNTELAKTVNVKTDRKPVLEIIDQILKDTNLAYTVVDRQVAIYNKAETKQQTGPSQSVTNVTGVVKDPTGETLIGVTVRVKGTQVGSLTDANGRFSITIPTVITEPILSFSYLGYQERDVSVDGKSEIIVTMQEKISELSEVIITGMGTVQKKVSIVGAITSVKVSDLRVPTTSLTSAFAGRLAGVISTSTSGQPGADASQFYIRGIGTFGGRATPLIMIDGVEATVNDLNYLPAESIESFSVLKDASATAIYGARGANGVMIVTTKRGEVGKTKIKVSVENSFNTPFSFPDFVDGVTYMEMYNEATSTRTGSTAGLPFSAEKIEGTRNNLNPYIYPNVDWKKLLFKDMAMSQRANINISGGGEKVTYYMSLQANHDGGILNTKDIYSFKNNVDVMSYTFQNNVDYKITSSTKVGLRMNAQLRQYKGTHTAPNTLFNNIFVANPVSFPATFPSEINPDVNHVSFGSSYLTGTNLRTNPYAAMLSTYRSQFSSTLTTTVDLQQDLDMLTEGLKVKGLVSFRNYFINGHYSVIEPYFYNVRQGSYDPYLGVNPNTPYALERIGSVGTDYINSRDLNSEAERNFNLQFWIDYNRTFGNHHLGGMFMYLQREVNKSKFSEDIFKALSQSYLPTRNQGVSGRATYDYDHRYLFEFNFGYNGTERLQKDRRFKFFPAVAMGWVPSNEAFFEPIKKVVSNLKIRGSYGLVGNDEMGTGKDLFGGDTAPHFLYLDEVLLNNKGYTTGVDLTTSANGPTVLKVGNPFTVWETAKKLNLGIDLELFNNLSIVFDYFYDKRERILLKRESFPQQLGFDIGKPWASIGEATNKGYEFSLNYIQPINEDLSIEMRGTLTLTENKLQKADEPAYPLEWQRLTGKPIGHTRGYIAERLFVDEEDIKNSPDQTQFGSVILPGDIKYKDLNGDGKINEDDRTMISPYGSTPKLQYGFGATAFWKKFDVGLFFQGTGKRTIMISGLHPFGTGEQNIFQFIADDYWTEDNPNPRAKYPRLDTRNSNNNTQPSTFWQRSGSFIRLKNAEVGYNLPFGRLYVNGTNLLTFSSFKLWDPELAWYTYPLSRTINVGMQLNF